MKFYNPLTGKHRRIKFSSLFLLEPDFFLKLASMPMSTIMIEQGHESLYKRMKNVSNEKSVKNVLKELLKIYNPQGPFVTKLINAIENDDFENQELQSKGAYEYFCEGLYSPDESRSYQHEFIISIERQTSSATSFLEKGVIQEAVEELRKQPICKHVIWPEANTLLENLESADSIKPLRYLISMEILIAILAATDVEICHKKNLDSSLFLPIMPSTKNDDKNPSSLLFDVCKQHMKVKSITEMLDKLSEFDESLLKRWSSGKHLPSNRNYIKLIKHSGDDKAHNFLIHQYIAAKAFHFIGYFFQDMQKNVMKLNLNELQKAKIRPLPDYPFGYASVQSWLDSRYPYWLEYHKDAIKRRGLLPSV